MKEGRVVESGTHEEEYRQDGSYTEIFDSMARSLNLDKISKTLEFINQS
jgi:ABC-type transport system involved in cytochrome bd biosynthesis fused ATPase/permease subunit